MFTRAEVRVYKPRRQKEVSSKEGDAKGHGIFKNVVRGDAEELISSSVSFFMNSASR